MAQCSGIISKRDTVCSSIQTQAKLMEVFSLAPSSVFYMAVDGAEEIVNGYLVKSPPSRPFFNQVSF